MDGPSPGLSSSIAPTPERAATTFSAATAQRTASCTACWRGPGSST